MDPRWIHPFTCVVAGPTGCGKTVWVKQFISHKSKVMTEIPHDIIWCYSEWQNGYEQISGVSFVDGIPEMTNWSDGKRRLIVIDDLMSEVDGRVTKLFTKGSHHKSVSVIFIVQNLFGRNPEQRTVTLNSHYLVCFKNPRDASQIAHLARQMYPGKSKYVQESFKDATEKPHGYLVFDLRQETPDHLRLRTNIFSDRQIVYVQK